MKEVGDKILSDDSSDEFLTLKPCDPHNDNEYTEDSHDSHDLNIDVYIYHNL